MSPFKINPLHFASPEDPWGPTSFTPESLTFSGVPYAPFIKTDKLGKIADWQAANEDELSLNNNNYNNNQNNLRKRDQYHAYGASAAKMFGAEVEEKGFSVVEASASALNTSGNSANKKTVLRSNRKYNNNANNTNNNNANNNNNNNNNSNNNNNNNNSSNNNNNGQVKYLKKPSSTADSKQTLKKKPLSTAASKLATANSWASPAPSTAATPVASAWGSVVQSATGKTHHSNFSISPTWKCIQSFDLEKFETLSSRPTGSQPLGSAGTFHYYQRDAFEQKNNVPLDPSIREITVQNSSNDSNLCNFAKENKGDVLITDNILAQLMCAADSISSWNIVVSKRNGKYFFDQPTDNYLVPVNETAEESNADDESISKEFAEIQSAFLNSVLGERKTQFDELPNPIKTKIAIPRAYKYTEINLNSSIVVRTALDTYAPTPNAPIAIHAFLNPSNNKWLNNFGGNVEKNFEEAIMNNYNVFKQWLIQAKFTGAETIKIGFVSRSDYKSNLDHLVVASASASANKLSAQLGLNLENCWGVFNTILESIKKASTEDNESFVIHKPENEEKLNIYKVPVGSNKL